LVFCLVHEGADAATYTFSDNKSSTNWATSLVQHHTGTAANDLSIAVSYCWSPNVGTGHIVTCTTNSSTSSRYVGGIAVNGTFGSASILAATTQKAEGKTVTSIDTADAGSLVTDAASICLQFVGNYFGEIITPASGWTGDAIGVGGRNLQSRIEASAGTFDPNPIVPSGGVEWVTIALALKETAGGAVYKPRATLLGVG
jgi:hypothetical protein